MKKPRLQHTAQRTMTSREQVAKWQADAPLKTTAPLPTTTTPPWRMQAFESAAVNAAFDTATPPFLHVATRLLPYCSPSVLPLLAYML